jgi:hypothetical protein
VEAFITQPLLTKRGHGQAPTMRGSDSKSVQMLDRDTSYSDAQSGVATGWRCVLRGTPCPQPRSPFAGLPGTLRTCTLERAWAECAAAGSFKRWARPRAC